MFADVLTSTNASDKRGNCLQMSTHFPSEPEDSVQIEANVKDGRFYLYVVPRVSKDVKCVNKEYKQGS